MPNCNAIRRQLAAAQAALAVLKLTSPSLSHSQRIIEAELDRLNSQASGDDFALYCSHIAQGEVLYEQLQIAFESHEATELDFWRSVDHYDQGLREYRSIAGKEFVALEADTLRLLSDMARFGIVLARQTIIYDFTGFFVIRTRGSRRISARQGVDAVIE